MATKHESGNDLTLSGRSAAAAARGVAFENLKIPAGSAP
jgi:hypothetical protein